MSSIPEEFSIKLTSAALPPLVAAVPAANADHLSDQPAAAALTATSSGWDSYDVWRRFIKDARDRRRADQP
jgi:hypothetical protein